VATTTVNFIVSSKVSERCNIQRLSLSFSVAFDAARKDIDTDAPTEWDWGAVDDLNDEELRLLRQGNGCVRVQ